uniref:energy-coupling factor transporter transmembrane component T family protein n=1 Tax=Olsenella uli TaxID=133926 RepID=UPI0028EC0AAC|nr:energy-coupling factor transporter transmembrane component T [Olsenella uli]
MALTDDNGLCSRLDVRTKLAVLLALIVTGACVKDFAWGSMVFAFACMLTFAIGRRKMALSFAASYALIMLVFWATLFLPRSVSGALGSTVLLARTCMPVFLFAAAFVSSTKIGDLTAALYSLRLPHALVVPLAVCVRFFPTLGQEAGAVLTSMHLRGLGLSTRNVVAHPVLTFESLLVPLMLRCAKIADELAASAVARGIDRPGLRTSYSPIRIAAADVAVLAITIAWCAGVIAAKTYFEGGLAV